MSKDLDQIQKKLASLKKRRDELSAEKSQTETGLLEKRQAAGGELLEGHGADATLISLTRDREKLAALETAIGQADIKIARLEKEYLDTQRQEAIDAYEKQIAQVRGVLSKSVQSLLQVSDDLEAIGVIGDPDGVSGYFSDESRAVKSLLQGLRNLGIQKFLETREKDDISYGGRNKVHEIKQARAGLKV